MAKTQYTYNCDKQLTATHRPDGNVVSLGYDTAGRLQSLTPSGLLASIEAAGLKLAFTYDGKLKKQETLTGPVAGTLSFTHDENFRITGISVNGQNVPRAHDPDGLLTQAGGLTLTRDGASGLITGTSLQNLTTTQDYNPFGELASFQASHNASPLLQYALSYDPLGRITAKDETLGGTSTRHEYGYDPAGRLATVTQNGSLARSYGYDANGNRIELNGSPIATYDEQDRLLTYAGTTYSYTANGTLNQKTGGSQVTQYAYDAFGNLRAVTLPDSTQIDYLVDGKNRRVGKKVNGTLTQAWLYQDQLKIAAEVDGSGTLVSRYVYGTKVNVPEYMEKGGKTYRLVTDHLGSVRLVVDAASGEVTQRIDYDEFGKVLNDTNPGFQPFGFAGGLYDPQTKLVRFGARDYDAETGRWTAKDPIGFRGGDAGLFNYALSNPISISDPTGKIVWALPILPPISSWIGGIIGGGLGAWLGWEVLGPLIKGMPTADDPPADEPGRCKEVRERCREVCSDLTLPTGDRCSQGVPFFNCYRDCQEAAGCS